jgi:L-lactate dehydrogenase complex protein LldG
MSAGLDLIELFAANCARNGMTVHRGEPPAIPGASVSRARYGLADPGSVVVFAGPEEPRARSLLPDVHVAVVEPDDILPDLPALLRAVRGELPSSLAIISGPSRSADIEMTLAIGVHGPCEQHVVIRSPSPA